MQLIILHQAVTVMIEQTTGLGTTSTVYNVDLVVKGEGHSKVTQCQEEEDDYVPLSTVGKKVSTAVQYKSDDTYVPIWTTNMPKTKREIRTSQSVDDTLLERSDLKGHDEGQGHSEGERSPGVKKAMSLDVAGNKTTHVILKDKSPGQPTKLSKGQTQGQGHIQTQDPKIKYHDDGLYDKNFRNYNGHLRKLKLVHGAPDLPQVHKAARVNDADKRSNTGQNLEPEIIEIQVPSLLERRGILLKEASSEDRPPPLSVKHGRNLRSYEQIGRSLERSKSKRLYSGATWDLQRSTEAPSGGQKGSGNRTLRDPNDQSAGLLHKLKRHLSRSKSYR